MDTQQPSPASGRATMPIVFVGHGSPMNAIEDSEFSRAWATTANALPRPRAILCVSAHWETNGTHVTAMANPGTIHDFYGFPPELFAMQYAAPGSPELAGRVREALGPEVGLDQAWGLDHGAWSVLARMYPAADVPVVQLSLDRTQPPARHYEIGRALAPLREEGVLILGSGNIVHNLSLIKWSGGAFDWAVQFDQAIRQAIVTGDHAAVIGYDRFGRNARLSVPTNYHYLPLLNVRGRRAPGEAPRFFAEGIALGSLSMRSVVFGG